MTIRERGQREQNPRQPDGEVGGRSLRGFERVLRFKFNNVFETQFSDWQFDLIYKHISVAMGL